MPGLPHVLVKENACHVSRPLIRSTQMNILEFVFQDFTHYISTLAFIAVILIMLAVFIRFVVVVIGTVILGIIFSLTTKTPIDQIKL